MRNMIVNICDGVTVTFTRETTINAYKEVKKCAEKLEEARKNVRIAYQDAFIDGEGYDRNDFYDWCDAENRAEVDLYKAYDRLMAC